MFLTLAATGRFLMHITTLLTTLVLFLAVLPASCAPVELLQGGDFSQGTEGWTITNGDNSKPVEVIDVEVGPFRKGLRFTVQPKPGDKPNTVRLAQTINRPLYAGEQLEFKVWMRSTEKAQAWLVVQQKAAPFGNLLLSLDNLIPQWREYTLRGALLQDANAGSCEIALDLGGASTTIEIAGARLLHSPPQPRLDLQVGHTGGVLDAAMSPDGTFIVSSGLDGAIKLWDAETGDLIRTLMANGSVAHGLTISPDSQTIAAAQQNGGIRLFSARQGTLLQAYKITTPGLSDVEFLPNGRTLAACATDGVIRIFDALTGRVQWSLEGHQGRVNTVAISRDGKWLVSGGDDKTVRLWNVTTGELVHTMTGHTGGVGAAISPDGQTVVSDSPQGDKTIRLWDASTGKEKGQLTERGTHAGNAPTKVSWSPDGKYIAAGDQDWDFSVRIWEAATGKLVHTLTPGVWVYAVRFSPDSKTLLTGTLDNLVRTWNVATGQLRLTMGRSLSSNAIAYSPDGQLLADGNTSSLRMWDADTGELKHVLRLGPGQDVRTVAFSPDGALLASAGAGGGPMVRLWDARKGTLLRTLGISGAAMRSIAFSPDGKTMACAGYHPVVTLWDVQSGQQLHKLAGHEKNAIDVGFALDGKAVTASSEDGTIRLWDAVTGASLHMIKAHKNGVLALKTSPDGKTLASAANDDVVKLWDAQSGQLKHQLKDWATTLAFSPDGKTLAGGAGYGARMWNVESGESEPSLHKPSPTTASICFSPDGRTVVAGGSQIDLWQLPSRRLVATLYALPEDEKDGNAIGAGSKPIGAAAKPLPAASKALTASSKALTASSKDVTGDAAANYLIVTPEGYYGGSAVADRYMRFALGPRSYPAECFQARLYRPELVRQALAGEVLPPLPEMKGIHPPLVTLSAMQTKVEGDRATVTVEARDDSAVEKLSFFVNGSLVTPQEQNASLRPLGAGSRSVSGSAASVSAASATKAGTRVAALNPADPEIHKVSQNKSFTLPLPSDATEIKIQAIAFDDDNLQSPRSEIFLQRELKNTSAATGRLLGLCVGISKYADASLNLNFADRDAQELSRELNEQRALYVSTHVAPLVNQDATRDGVRAALDKLIAQATRADTVVILLSGHGWRDQKHNFYFATHDVKQDNVAGSALPWRDVTDRLARLSQNSKRVIVLLDACHSGSVATNEELTKAILSANAGVLLFASSRGSEVSLEMPELQHGAFTKATVEAADGQAAPADEKTVTMLDFLSYVSRRVKTLSSNRQHPQVPFLQDFDTDAPLTAKP